MSSSSSRAISSIYLGNDGWLAALWLIRGEWLWCAVTSPGAIPRHLQRLRRELEFFILPERRSHRSYGRAVKLGEQQEKATAASSSR